MFSSDTSLEGRDLWLFWGFSVSSVWFNDTTTISGDDMIADC